ncbi:Cu-Zn family superoxide dismutase [Actinocorallia herbida]|uniref:Cu-Zn family superoxide dismutase n=1 Tax=Actinocorallia herbida TaxID=58109 RepID=A0A3N1D8Y3_9ACTN|nr:superoxide dismutase family protein [Actinocorallia herbida]ROO89992.1 Cu-Zn family superoxide dismutase [Actinocorallia herbida]
MFRIRQLALAVAVGAGGTAIAAAAAASAAGDAQDPQATAVIKTAEGATVGSLTVDAENGPARVTIKAQGLPPGYHGLHFHQTGVCDANSKDPATGSPFFSAGPHLDTGGHEHAHHTGDLPDLLINTDGTGTATAVSDRFQVDQLFDADGTSVIIHANADNQSNIPDRYTAPDGQKGPDADTLKAGDSGGRTACGILQKP